MENNYLLINFNMFTLNHTITLMTEQGANALGHYRLEDIPESIVIYSNEYNAHNIKIIGDKSYGDILKENILIEEKQKYNLNNLEIEVI